MTGALSSEMTSTWSQHRYRVQSSVAVTPVIRELRLTPLGNRLAFRAGQYVLLGDVDWRVPQRSYSVANAPREDGSISLLVTLVQDGPTSTWAHGLRSGDGVLLEGPFGTFVGADDRTGPALLLGAGSGLAPVRALAEALLERVPQRPVTLLFSCRTRADRIDHERFEQWQRERRDFRYLCTLTRDATAPLHARLPVLLADCVGRDLSGWEVFASGPPGFVVGCAAAAQALGALATDVRTEEFFTDPQPWLGAMPSMPEGGTIPREAP